VEPTQRMAAAARELVAVLQPEQAALLAGSLDDPRLREWTYLPGPRPGLCLTDLTADQRQAASALLETGHSPSGAVLVSGALEVERIRRELVGGAPVTDDRYWLRLMGDPGADRPWGWRVNGHHLAVHVVVTGDRFTVTPHFVGAEPAEVPSGAQAGRRLLGPEEDLARELLGLLDPDQRRVAVFAELPPDDILTRADPVANPELLPTGLRHADLALAQQDVLARLVRRYLDRAPAAYAEHCWQEAVRDGLDDIAFSWAGGADRGDRHYYCVSAPGFLIEYDNTQDGGNHAHSVWRHLRDDFGADLLREHYVGQHGAPS